MPHNSGPGRTRAWTELAPGVHLATSRRYTTSTVVIDAPDGALLVDPSWDPDELAATAADLRGITLRAGFATHAHYDHVLWHPDLPDVPRYASLGAAALADAERAANAAGLGPDFPTALVDLAGRLTPLENADAATTLGEHIELVTHDAHSTGHTAVWVADRRVLLVGDMLSDLEIPLATETGLAAYRAGLDVLLPYVEQAQVVVPGHGRPAVGQQGLLRWQADSDYLDAVIGGAPAADDDPRLHEVSGAADNRDAHRAHRSLAAARPGDSGHPPQHH